MLINAIGQLAAAFLATIAFSVLFHVPKKQYFVCGLTGTLGWLVYLIVNLKFSNTLACFAATVVIVFCARLFAVWRKVPSAIVLGIVCVFVIPNKWFRGLKL